MLENIQFQLLLATFAGWVGRQQAAVIAYLVEENSVLKEQLESGGKRLRFTDDQRRRLLHNRGLDCSRVGQVLHVIRHRHRHAARSRRRNDDEPDLGVDGADCPKFDRQRGRFSDRKTISDHRSRREVLAQIPINLRELRCRNSTHVVPGAEHERVRGTVREVDQGGVSRSDDLPGARVACSSDRGVRRALSR